MKMKQKIAMSVRVIFLVSMSHACAIAHNHDQCAHLQPRQEIQNLGPLDFHQKGRREFDVNHHGLVRVA